jgi:hypothetical protein
MNSPRYRSAQLLKTSARVLLLCTAWIIIGCGVELHAAGSELSESDVKAAFIAKFSQFVKWPSSRSSMTVGILGEDPFGGALEGMIKVKRSKRVEDLKNCQIIFISKSERGNIGTILEGLVGANILTVGESDGFAKQGGAIGFVLVGDKVRFEINAGAARRAGLNIDLQLLKLAVRVFGQ